jgi:poly(hydroxyalkanoate) depolymerase family esterase
MTTFPLGESEARPRTFELFLRKRKLTMNDMLNSNKMVEATRLTRAGRLTEATALLQRMLRGETEPDMASAAAGEMAHASVGREPLIIHANASAIEEMTRPPSSRPPSSRFGIDSRPADVIFAGAATTVQPQTVSGLSALADRAKRLRSGLGFPGLTERAPVSTPDIVPEGGQFIEATYSNPAGSRAYKLYIPSGYHGQALPLIVMLHGCAQAPDDFAAGTRMNVVAEERTCLVVYPAQPRSANAAKCWNWFRPGDQRRGQGEPSLIAGITRQVMRDYSVDPQRVYVGGLSAGAAAAVVMGATYSDLYAAIGVHSGLACNAANDLPSAFAAMRQGELRDTFGSGNISAMPGHGSAIPTIVFHGDRDITVHPRNGDHVIAQSKRAANLPKTVHRGRVPGGHAYTRTIYSDASGRTIFEQWDIHGAGSFTDPRGPDASREMLRFFLQHRMPAAT